MASISLAVISTILSIPQSIASTLQLFSYIPSTEEDSDEQARRSMLESLERRCTACEERAQADIHCESQRQQLLFLFSRLRRLIAEGRNKQLQNTKPVELLCDVVEDALMQAVSASSTTTARLQTNEDEIASIKDKMRRDSPLQTAIKYSHIYCSTITPPDIEIHQDNFVRSFGMLDDELCFKEYFAFGADQPKTKSRICWMMLLLTELKCPRLLEPVKVFAVPGGSHPGFYTFSRVPSSNQVGVQRSLYTLAECVSRVRNKKWVLVQLSEAVEEIHKHSILHKNICAYNVILDDADNAWLAGFSSSRLGEQDSYKIPAEEHERMKMVYFDSMETSNHVRSFKCDIDALGVTMLEVAVGKSFVQNTELIKAKRDIFRLLRDHCKPGALQDLIHNCLAPEARSRPHAFQIKSRLEFMDAQDFLKATTNTTL